MSVAVGPPWQISHRLPERVATAVFRNLLIADSGKGHVEEMVRMLRDIPAVRDARLNLLHVVSEQAGENYAEHSQKAAGIVAEAVQRLGLNPTDVNTIIRQGDTKQTVLKVADELDADLIVMGSRGLGRLQSILSNSASQYVFQLSTRPMLLVRDDLYVRHINRVMVAVDGTGVGDDALRLACELVRDTPGASLTGIHISRQDITPTRGGKSPADELLEKAVQRARAFGVEMKGIHRTGDIGRMDARGYVYIEDRKKDMINVSGFNVYPNEVESVAVTHPGVLEAAAVAKADERSGEVVALFIVRKDPALTADAVIEHCRAALTGYKVPKYVYFKNDLPKTNVGKILRRELRDEAQKL